MTITKEGALASFYTTNKAPIKHLRVYFSPKQAGEGDPSPDNVRPITGWTGITLYKCGKNITLAKDAEMMMTLPLVVSSANRGDIILGLPENENFVLSCKTTEGLGVQSNRRLYLYGAVKNQYINTGSEHPGTYGIIVKPSSSLGEMIVLHNYQGLLGLQGVLYDIQLERGTTPTAYEPYNGIRQEINWQSIGEIPGGYVDLVTGDVWKNFELIDMGNLEWSLTNGRFYAPINDIQIGDDNSYMSTAKCDIYKTTTYNNLIRNGAVGIAVNNAAFIRVYDPDYTTIDDFITAITGHKLAYPLAEPVKVGTINPITLETLIGQNNIWSNADRVEVEYDLAESNDELYRRRNILLKSAPHIVTPTAENLHSFNTDMEAPLKEFKAHFSPKQDLHGYSDPWLAGNGKNTFPYPFIDTTKTVDGIKFTDLGDGRITVSGTSTAESGYTYFELRDDIPFGTGYKNFSYVGKTYTINGKTMDMNGLVSGIGAEYITTSEGIGRVHLRVTAGATVNTTIAPMIYDSENPLSAFEPYENVCPITGLTGIGIGITGKNLIPADYKIATGTWKPTGGVISWSVYNMGQFLVPKGTLYWGAATTGTAYTALMDGPIKSGEKTYKVVTTSNRTGYTFDNSDGHKYMLTTCTYDQHIDRKTYVFIPGQTGTGYAPPSGKNYEIDWFSDHGEIFGGYVDPINGEIVEEYGIIIMDGVTDGGYYKSPKKFYGKSGVSGTNAYYARFQDAVPINNNAENWLCNISPVYNWGQGEIPKSTDRIVFLQFYASSTGSNEPRLAFPLDSEINTLAKANQFLKDMYDAGTPVIYSYPLKTPIHHSIDSVELKTVQGLNNIWSSANGPIELSYWTH